MNRADLMGLTFGRLTVAAFVETRNTNAYWNCVCQCGRSATVSACHLKSGHTASCGCFQKERTSKTHRRHGQSSTPEGGRVLRGSAYMSWQLMKGRCLSPKNNKYSEYGERGITVCDRWLNSFENFLEDMGPRPSGMTLDRKDNDRGYSTENCRWATYHEQRMNQRRMKRDLEPIRT